MHERDENAPGHPGPARDPAADGEPGDDWGDVQVGRWSGGPPPRAPVPSAANGAWAGDLARSDPEEPGVPASHAGVGPKGYRRSDERIREDVCEALTADAAIDPSDVTVSVTGGAVTLEGGVSDADTKQRIVDRVRAVAGVRDVQNRLRVAGDRAAPAAAPGRVTGEEDR